MRHRRWTLVAGLIAVSVLQAGAASAASRLVFRNPYTEPFSDTELACDGTSVELSGLLRHNVIIVEDADGGLHSTYAIRFVLSGLGEDGTRYRASAVSNGAEYFSADEIPSNGTFTDVFHLISLDESPNLLIHATFHITVNGVGTVPTFTNDLDIVCP